MPKFRILSEEEKKEILERYGTTEEKMPKMFDSDPSAKRLGAKPGDLLEITRSSEVAGESVYYRIVVRS